MDFKFPYNIAGTVTNVVVTIEDDIVAEAKKMGADMTAIEAEAKNAIDGFVHKVTSRGFWSNLAHKIEDGVDALVHDVESLGEPKPPVPPTTP